MVISVIMVVIVIHNSYNSYNMLARSEANKFDGGEPFASAKSSGNGHSWLLACQRS
jgi:hypothetical protein